MDYNYVKGIGLRFLRGFAAGAIGTMAPIGIVTAKWGDVITGLSVLALVGLSGGITGGLLALDKYIRETAK